MRARRVLHCFVLICVLGVVESKGVTIDAAASGPVGNKQLVGFNRQFEGSVDLTAGTSIRGIAGGMCADAYNWKTQEGATRSGPTPVTTLEFMREARDNNTEVVLSVNCRGTGPSVDWLFDFVYADNDPNHLATLAGDWVRYCNYILQTYREGDTITNPTDLAILNGITWSPKLLAPGEKSTPKVKYWEIGNEPDNGIGVNDYLAYNPALGETGNEPNRFDYKLHYKLITAAMIAQDATIKVGPCIANAWDIWWLTPVLNDLTLRMDFISEHPYYYQDPMYVFNESTTVEQTEALLRNLDWELNRQHDHLVDNVITPTATNPNNLQYLASEWDAMSAVGYPNVAMVANALGFAETIFGMTQIGFHSAQYWNNTRTAGGVRWPVDLAMSGMRDHFGGVLANKYTDGSNFRLYTMVDPNKVVLWGINFDNDSNTVLAITVNNLPFDISNAVVKKMVLTGTAGRDTQLHLYGNYGDDFVEWITTDITAGFNPASFNVTFHHATITVIRIEKLICGHPDAPAYLDGDINEDCKVNFADFAEVAANWAHCTNLGNLDCTQ